MDRGKEWLLCLAVYLGFTAAPAGVFGQPASMVGNKESATQESLADKPVLKPGTDQRKELQRLYQEATRQYATIDCYIARLRRREQVAGKDRPEEVISLKFRKEPWSVMLKWVGKEGKGREVIFVKGQYESKIQTLLAAGDSLLLAAGSRMALSPDSVLVRSASRHHITEVGIGAVIDRFGALVNAPHPDGQPEPTLTYLGETRRPEFNSPLELVKETIPPKADPNLPNGALRLLFFDTTNHLPVLLITRNELNHIVEYYCYDRFQFSVKLDDLDFNPDLLWQKKKP
jgi:hypothetical protein